MQIVSLKRKIRSFLEYLQYHTNLDMLYLARGGFWSGLGFGTSSILSAIIVYLFANFVPKETYGTYRYILSLAGSLGFLTLTGMNIAVTQAVANGYDGALKQAIKIQLRWNFIFFIASFGLGLYYLLHNNSTIAISLILIGLGFPLNATYNTYGAFLGGKKDFRRASLYATMSTIVYIILMTAAILITHNIIILVAVYAFSNLLPTIYFYKRTLQIYHPQGDSAHEAKELKHYGKHLSIINIFSTIASYLDKIVVFHFLGAVQLAIYALAQAIPERIRGYLKNMMNIILPKLSDKTIDDIRPIFYKRVLQGIAAGTLISIGYIIVAPIVFKLFLPKYLDSIRYSQVISLEFIFTTAASYVGSVFRSQKMIRTIYLSSVGANVIRIGFIVGLGAWLGIWGVIIATLGVHTVGTLFNFFLWHHELQHYQLG